MSKVMGIYVKFTKTTHQIWSCHLTLTPNFENFYLSPNSVKIKKLQAKNKLGNGKHPSPPSAYRVKEFMPDIYPKELTISKTTESTSVASYLDLLFTRDKSNNITTKLYDKRDAFGFHIVNFPFISSNIASAPAYGVYASQLIRYAIVAQIIVTFITPQGPSDKTSVTGLQS